MADSEGTFGGDGSVFWEVRAANVKRGIFECDVKKKMSVQNGHNGTAKRTKFQIAITLPAKGRDAFLSKLIETLTGLDKSKTFFEFELPVEPGNHRQVSVSWDSSAADFKPSWPKP